MNTYFILYKVKDKECKEHTLSIIKETISITSINIDTFKRFCKDDLEIRGFEMFGNSIISITILNINKIN